ncbi:hypothetical protein WICMUC_002445 [Wickerhamomyces mucosus]|uniref:NAD(P)-binding protein n=1 Tax=Wickerhamomyces mucosus TaxID=1378264 RepID=A0A9P8TEQ6_9ASCO|nr:hypothetical protein WICMUC_002445 [Wickerhamomyces mucosus]
MGPFSRFNELITGILNSLNTKALDPNHDIILITGGCSGLGSELVKEFVKRKFLKIIVFDLNLPKHSQSSAIHYYNCDVSNSKRIQELHKDIKRNLGIVTVVINNAGITIGKPLLEMSFEEVELVIKVNLLSNFYINKTFLPDMINLKRGYIVTIASVLGYMSPANLTAYGASKSGLIAFHESLTHELGSPLDMDKNSNESIRTLLISPGQLRTSMFSEVRTPSTMLAPVLEPSWLAQKIIDAIEYGTRGELIFPMYGNFLPLFRSLPWPITHFVRLLSGMDQSMRRWNSRVLENENLENSDNT